eukprot:386894-Pleurochrysis_carterae.AAC.4
MQPGARTCLQVCTQVRATTNARTYVQSRVCGRSRTSPWLRVHETTNPSDSHAPPHARTRESSSSYTRFHAA